MSTWKPPNRSKTWDKSQIAESKLIARADQLAAFEEFHETMLPKLREMLAEGKTPKEIFTAWAPFMAARMVNIGLTERDSSKALAAAEKVIHQAEGKPTENKQVTHRMAALTDEQLDALLYSRLKEVEAIEVATGTPLAEADDET